MFRSLRQQNLYSFSRRYTLARTIRPIVSLNQKRPISYTLSRVKSAVETSGYGLVVLAGAGVIVSTLYFVFTDSKKVALANEQYERVLSELKENKAVQRYLGDEIKGQYEVEWRNRRSSGRVGLDSCSS